LLVVFSSLPPGAPAVSVVAEDEMNGSFTET
jgi:hypothetical protein